MKLTEQAIAKAPPGAVLRDATVPGLHLRVFPRRRTYYMYYRTRAGKERRPKLGDANVLSLAKARQLAKAMLAAVAAGEDPAAARISARTAGTVAELADRYLLEHAVGKKSKANDENLIDLYVKPKLGRLQTTEVQYEDIAALHHSLRDKPYQANRLLALLSKMFTLAEQWQVRPERSNPCRHVQRFPERKRRRYVRSDGEAQRLAQTLVGLEPHFPEQIAFFWVLIFSGARPSEVLRFTWDDLQGNRITLAEHKAEYTGDARTIYLPAFVIEKLSRLPKATDRIFTFATAPKRLWRRIRVEAQCPGLRMYDLRHTFASAAMAAGYSLNHIGELLGHRNTQTTARYAHLMDDPQREAVEATATLLQTMLGAAQHSCVAVEPPSPP